MGSFGKPKDLFGEYHKEIISELKDMMKEVRDEGYAERELNEILMEDVRVRNEKDYIRLKDREIPATLAGILKRSGFGKCQIFKQTSAVPSAEYIGVCRLPEVITINFDVDTDLKETGTVYLVSVSAKKGGMDSFLLPYYKRVY